MNIAYTKDGVVVYIAPEQSPAPSDIEYDGTLDATGASLGSRWDGTRFVLSNMPEDRYITGFALLDRFSMDELAAIELLAADNPSDAKETRLLSARLRMSLRKIDQAEYIDLDRPELREELSNLELLQVLATGRTAQILDAPVEDFERP